MTLFEAYFDESYLAEGDRHFVVAGYIFDEDNARLLDAKWAASLGRYNLPYFRMSSCAHGNPPFKHLTKAECIAVEKEMIRHVIAHALFGIYYSVSAQNIADIPIDPVDPFPTPYTLLCYWSLVGIKLRMDEGNFDGRISYFFEAGDNHEKQANTVLNDMFKTPKQRSNFRYAGHSFVKKHTSGAVQSADMLAWHITTNHRRRAQGQAKRRDFVELLKCPTSGYSVGAPSVKEFRSSVMSWSQQEKDRFTASRRSR